MSDERAEQTVGTIKRSVTRVVTGSDLEWYATVSWAAFCDCRQFKRRGLSLFKLFYGAKLKVIPVDTQGEKNIGQGLRSLKVLGVYGVWATKADDFQRLVAQRSHKDERSKDGDSVLVVHGPVFTPAKRPAFKSKFTDRALWKKLKIYSKSLNQEPVGTCAIGFMLDISCTITATSTYVNCRVVSDVW